MQDIFAMAGIILTVKSRFPLKKKKLPPSQTILLVMIIPTKNINLSMTLARFFHVWESLEVIRIIALRENVKARPVQSHFTHISINQKTYKKFFPTPKTPVTKITTFDPHQAERNPSADFKSPQSGEEVCKCPPKPTDAFSIATD